MSFNSNNLTIAILEDDADFGPLLKEMLEDEGYIVSLHTNAISALAFIDNNPVDLVISDLFIKEDGQLSEQGGLTLISKIKQIMHHPAPVIAISGSFANDKICAVSSATTLGADHTLAKPIDPNELIRLVQHYLRKSDSKKRA